MYNLALSSIIESIPMYIPPHYQNHNSEEVKEFIKQNSFGILINVMENKPWGTHIPLETGAG